MKNYKNFLQLIQKAHAGQTRNGGNVPYWRHCYRVSKLLEHAFSITEEGSSTETKLIILTALGHDLYEDTEIKREFIVKKFGNKVDALIFEMTNIYGDQNIREYCKKFHIISEQALLIKVADLIDNMIDGAYAVYKNGHKWTKEFLWPITHQQWLTISKIKFDQFLKTAFYLKSLADFGNHSLQTAIQKTIL